MRAKRPTIHCPAPTSSPRKCAATASSGRYRKDGSVGFSVRLARPCHCGTRRTSGVPSPTSGANASAELVVPRSIPMAKRARSFVKTTSRGGPALFRADLELNLPSAIGVRVPHPKLKDAKFGDDGADADRHHLPHRDVQCRDRDFEQAGVIKLTLGVGEYLSWRIAASYRGGEKPKLRRAAGDKAELASFDQQFRAFLHPLWDNAQCLQRRLVARNGGHRRFQADVIGARRAGLDAHALAGGAEASVDRAAACDGEVWFETLQFADWLAPIPRRQQIKHPGTDWRGL